MGMSTHVVGFRPADQKWLKMKTVWDACEEAGIKPPDEVRRFFDGRKPDPEGVEISEDALSAAGALWPWKGDYREGFEVAVLNLPKDVTLIRFYNSW